MPYHFEVDPEQHSADREKESKMPCQYQGFCVPLEQANYTFQLCLGESQGKNVTSKLLFVVKTEMSSDKQEFFRLCTITEV